MDIALNPLGGVVMLLEIGVIVGLLCVPLTIFLARQEPVAPFLNPGLVGAGILGVEVISKVLRA